MRKRELVGCFSFTLIAILLSRGCACADPESFVRGGPILTTLFFLGEGGFKYHYKQTIVGPPAKRHINSVSLTGR